MDSKRIDQRELLVDRERLSEVLSSNTAWFMRLWRAGTGLRDSLEHDPIHIDVALLSRRTDGNTSDQWIDGQTSAGPIRDELVQALRKICGDFCSFLTEIHQLIGYGEQYRSSDQLSVSRPDELVTAFWPAI